MQTIMILLVSFARAEETNPNLASNTISLFVWALITFTIAFFLSSYLSTDHLKKNKWFVGIIVFILFIACLLIYLLIDQQHGVVITAVYLFGMIFGFGIHVCENHKN